MRRPGLAPILVFFTVLAAVCGSVMLDIDEFRVIKEPYEMLGGDYALGYLRAGEVGRAVDVAARSYRFYWTWRPLGSAVIPERDLPLFAEEERRFGYVRPEAVPRADEAMMRRRLVVPEPGRFYRNGAGAPLLTSVLRIPALALTRVLTLRGDDLLALQYRVSHHPLFLVPRLQGLLAGLLCIVLVHRALRRETDATGAWFGAAVMGAFPTAVLFFPNLHYDALLAPFVFAAGALFARGRHVAAGVCFGLALACKNTAVFLLPAIALFVAMEAVRVARSEGAAAARAALARRGRGVLAFVALGLVCLLPFAHPGHTALEILTPVVQRPMDPRGEDLTKFSLKQGRTVETVSGVSVRVQRREFTQVKGAAGYGLSLLVVALGLPLLWYRVRGPLGLFAIAMLLVSFPYRVVFGDGLGYRALMFVPFFAVLVPLALGPRARIAVLAGLAGLSLLFAADPMAANGMIYNLVDGRSLIETLTGAPPR